MSASRTDRATVLLALVAVAATCVLFALVARAPFLSEDWTQLEAARAIATRAEAMSLQREPLRPLQHGFFWLLAHSGLDPTSPASAALARVPAFAMHLGAIAALFALARASGLVVRAAALAACLFALAPNVKSLAWSAAIGSPGRVCFELAALACFAWHARERRAWRGVLGLLCFAIALGFHESALLAPLVFGLWLAAGDERGLRAGLRNWARALRDPFVAAFTGGGLLHLIQLAAFRPQRHHGWKDIDALPANVAKAVLSLAPEPLRASAVGGLRGDQGTVGLVLGCAAVAGLAVLFLLALRVPIAAPDAGASCGSDALRGHAALRGPVALRGRGIVRFAALAIAVDLGLAVLGTGFAQRYAYFSSALAALALAALVGDVPRGRALAIVALVAVAWAADAVVDALQLARAGAIARGVVADARAARERLGGVPIALVDLPDMGGGEEDIPLFNWGARQMLAAHGAAGPWLFWRTRAYRTSTDVELVGADRVERARAEGAPRLLVFDAARGALARE